ncbi:class I SAM-dependent methyltransferase [Actinocatenispora rupis]|uniref:Methyltransferase n=1 Tax=Actinocatenispora rupis TaxID=519421 RepID=A0A8J3J780_9ACTN|nr:class I SAM-dependent methyltransferase [Actinocatenispora rupis]GID15383.1 methyltransferase [Actinocatenispora rupis]
MANTEQARAWNGNSGQHFIAERARHERMRAPLTAALLAASRITRTDSVLDVGCGCGDTTIAAATAAPDGHALGVDLSEPMLAEARRLAKLAGVTNVEFRHADAQTDPLETAYDVVVSSFGVMFFDDPQTAFAALAATLRPGGRLAFLCWQDAARNDFLAVPIGAVASITQPPQLAAPGEPGPFSLADPDHIRELLTGAGFTDITVTGLTEQLLIGTDTTDTIAYYLGTPAARGLLADANDATAGAAAAALESALRPHQGPDGVRLGAAAWLVTAHR